MTAWPPKPQGSRTFTRWQKAGLVTTTPEGFSLHDVDALTEITRS